VKHSKIQEQILKLAEKRRSKLKILPKEVSFWDGLPIESAVVDHAKVEPVKPSIRDSQNVTQVKANQKGDLSPKSPKLKPKLHQAPSITEISNVPTHQPSFMLPTLSR